MEDALLLLAGLWPLDGWRHVTQIALGPTGLLVALGSVAVLEGVHYAIKHEAMRRLFETAPAWHRWLLIYALAAVILLFGMAGTRPFVYFRF